MRPIETLLVLLLIPAVAWRLGGPRQDRLHSWFGFGALGLSAVQLVMEGFRWQLVVPYLLAAVLAGVSRRPHSEPHRPRWRIVAWVTLAILAVGLPVMLPIPTLPSPDGPYSVGTTTIVAVDETRAETYGPNPGGPRTLPIHIWYPAELLEGPAPGWLTREVAGTVATAYGLPAFFLDHLSLTPTHARRDAPFVSGDDAFPVVIYSHGWGGFGRISPDQPEILASHGYVVIAPDHTFGALVAEFPDGLVGIDESALPDEESVDEATFDLASTRLVATYAADLTFVLDLLTTIEPVGLGMGDRIDTSRIGIFGHSTGGGAAVAACQPDLRCDAVLGFDPWVIPVDPYLISEGLTQPFLALRSDGWVGEENDRVLLDLHASGRSPSTIMALQGADHSDFVALSQISPLARYLGFSGSIPPPIVRAAIERTLLAFFDTHLRSLDTPLPELERLRIDLQR